MACQTNQFSNCRALYHTLAGHVTLKRSSKLNVISQFWWFRGFCWMEENVKAGALPNEFNWPLASLKILKDRLVTALFQSKYGAEAVQSMNKIAGRSASRIRRNK